LKLPPEAIDQLSSVVIHQRVKCGLDLDCAESRVGFPSD
jgi:hypothetical protein